MKQAFKRSLSILVALALVLSLAVGIIPMQAKAASGITEASGHLESAYVEWASVSGATGYNVYVKKAGGSYVQLDTELIRKYPTYWRADAVGLAAGSYTLKVVPVVNGSEKADQAMETGTLTVLAHNRDGYAHSGGYNVGAYNPDGTLMSNAKVFYVTKDTVNTVTITEGSKTYTGIGKLVKEYARTTSNPIVIRIIGEVPIPSATTSGQIEVKGNIVPVTIEGIGEDATCNGWGFKLSTCENVEVRNIGFMNNDSTEGDSVTLQNAVRSWVHNCDFFYGLPGSDADQVKGDGALDTKHSTYITHSYNHFWDCGKVNLQGSNASDTSNYITYHHNWYDHSDSRHPRVRVATVHVYNNYYDGNAGYGVGAARDSDIFVENNYFRNCNRPMLISDQGTDTTETMSGEPGGMIKAYGNVMIGTYNFIPYSSNNTSFDAYVASSRNETVPSSVKASNGGAGYNNFDTASDFYSYQVDTAETAVTNVTAYAGRINQGDFQWTFDNEVDDFTDDVNTELKAAVLAYETTLVSVGGNSVTGGSDDEEHTHSYTASVTTAATCTTSGTRTYTCSCGASYTENIAATGHSYSEGACTVCGAADPDYDDGTGDSGEGGEGGDVTVPASAYIHNFTDDGFTSDFFTISGSQLTNGKHGTYTYDFGYGTETLNYALKFDSAGSVSFTAPADGKLTFAAATSSTNRKIGVFDAAGNEIGILAVPNTNTLYVMTVDVSANTTYTVKRTSNESGLYYIAYAPNSGSGDVHTHSYSESVTTAATCDKAGVKTFTCSCGASYTEAIPALGHSEVTVKGYAATCDTDGLTDGVSCSVCSAVITAQEAIPALGHDYVSSIKAPTCTESGLRTNACNNCGDVTTEVIPATG
ncbi:MAG: hypothetical protein IJN53_08100, partial [Oscillospiraceae bacterium]|nr:hypothetical protein [Oscillospiraceae bacterium]